MADETHTHTPDAPIDGGTCTFGPPEGAPDATGTFHPPTAPALAPIPAIPGYEILEAVGHGGMGRVFRAHQLATGRVVAVKLILAGEFATPAARERFRAEIEATAKLSHPHIVQLYEAGEAAGRAFLSCEFVAGGSLAARLDGTPWDAKRAARLLIPLAQAVAHAHAAQILHRDLKPANILLATDDTPKVADFGLAKRLDSDSNTQTGTVMGTPSYMPPEQAGGAKAVGPPADVYSLGAILYELLTGRPPFKGADFVETLDLVRTQEVVPPRVLQPKLPRDAETVCLKCLQKDATKRYATATDLAADLERFLEDRPIVARPVGSAERAWRWCRRNPAVAALLAAVLLVFATGAAVASYFAIQADERAEEAARREREANDQRVRANAEAERANKESAKLLAERERTEDLLYASQINQANVAANEYRTFRLNQLLDATRPQPNRPDRRGWEWHYLDRVARSWDSERRIDFAPNGLPPLLPEGYGLEFSLTAEGKRLIASVVPENYAVRQPTDERILDIDTGRLIRRFSKPASDPGDKPIYRKFCPEGRFAAVTEVHNPRPPAVESVRYRVRLINLDTDRVEMTFPDFEVQPRVWVATGGRRVVFAFTAFSPGPTAEPESWLEVWDRGQAAPVRRALRSGADKTSARVNEISPDGKTAVVRFTEGTDPRRENRLALWNIVGEPTLISTLQTAGQFGGFVFSPGGQTFCVKEEIERDQMYTLFDTRTGRRVGRWQVPDELPGVFSYFPSAVSDDGRRIVLNVPAGVVVAERFGSAPPPHEPFGAGREAPGDVQENWRATRVNGSSDSLALSADGRLHSVDRDGTLRGWNFNPFPDRPLTWPTYAHIEHFESVANFDHRVRWVVCPSERVEKEPMNRKRLRVYDAAERRTVREFEVDSPADVTGQVSPDGRHVLLQHRYFTEKEWASDFRVSLRRLDDPTRELVGSTGGPGHREAEFSSDGRWAIESFRQLDDYDLVTVTAWRVSDGKTATAAVAVEGMKAAPAVVAPDGRFVVATWPKPSSRDTVAVPLTCRCYDPETGKELWAWTPSDAFRVSKDEGCFEHQLFFAPGGRELALVKASDDGSVKAWVLDAATGARMRELDTPRATHRREPVTLDPVFGGAVRQNGAFGPGGRLAVWLNDEVLVWDGQKREPVHRLGGHDRVPLAVAFSADGSRLFSLDRDGDNASYPGKRTLHVWEVANGRELLTVRLSGAVPPGTGPSNFRRGGMWIDGDRLLILTLDGVRVFDGTPRKE